MKSKIKLSIVDDYIKIVLIENFCNNFSLPLNNSILGDLKSLSSSLKNTYNQILDILKMKDSSFEILSYELSENNNLFMQQKKENFSNLKNFCEHNINLLNSINCNLENKLNKLKINRPLLLNRKET